jgi:predicted secreted Zn-dependent protease
VRIDPCVEVDTQEPRTRTDTHIRQIWPHVVIEDVDRHAEVHRRTSTTEANATAGMCGGGGHFFTVFR